jgi:hypothetical protein
MEKKLRDFGLMAGRVELIKGYFKDTLNDVFKARLRAENRRIGVAFLDCNIPSLARVNHGPAQKPRHRLSHSLTKTAKSTPPVETSSICTEFVLVVATWRYC